MLPSPRRARYSGRDRPACRMNHTGRRDAGWRRQAARKGSLGAASVGVGWGTVITVPGAVGSGDPPTYPARPTYPDRRRARHGRSATAVAKTDCKLAPINQNRFKFLVQQTPHFALHLMQGMAERLRRST